ncbi:hypothetical protein BpHYR1_054108 [Brachionus plicatilis]|uniref:Uncharacterized protein n=1 Tax=Brachionus plicatilis TaxID=10195 RepID=A0A3M7SMQ9_BRAPC|nr:hypothetical protein BpHYR1_054108 [Brachionus plicatilis]
MPWFLDLDDENRVVLKSQNKSNWNNSSFLPFKLVNLAAKYYNETNLNFIKQIIFNKVYVFYLKIKFKIFKFIKFNAWKEQYELNELEVMFSKKSLAESEVSTTSATKKSPKESIKSDSSVNFKVEYKLVDEMNNDSLLKEKCVNISIEEQEYKLNLIWLDKKTFVHLSQVLDLLKYNEEFFVSFLSNEQFHKMFAQNKEDSQNLPIFNWLSFTLGLDLNDQNETYFVVYENLGKMVKKICSPSISKLVDEAFNTKKRRKRQTSSIELNRKVSYFDRQIDLLNKQIMEENDKNSIENQQAIVLLNKFLETKNY